MRRRRHIADETVLRLLMIARAVRTGELPAPVSEPDSDKLAPAALKLPEGSQELAPPGQAPGAPESALASLSEAGADPRVTLRGGDMVDALIEGGGIGI